MIQVQVSCSVVFLFACVLKTSSPFDILPNTPCRYKDDPKYGGILVDCQGQGLTSLPPPNWIPTKTTSLLLQYNSISRMDEDSLREATELRYLSLNGNNLAVVEPKAIRSNIRLEILDLESNYIKLYNLTAPWFDQLHNLVELRLAYNHNGDLGPGHAYSPFLLSGLTSLTTLTLDTFTGKLNFNGILNDTKNLTNLVIAGGVSSIVNDSFKGFNDIDLKQLLIINANIRIIETGAFSYLKSLDSYSIIDTPVGLIQTLESLAPFVKRNMTTLRFHGVNDHDASVARFTLDSVLSVRNARYLSQICVKHFEYRDNQLFFIEPKTLTSRLWSKCLISLDLSMNPLLGEFVVLVRLVLLHKLQSLRIINRKYSLFDKDGKIQSSAFQSYSSSNFDSYANADQRAILYNHVSGLNTNLTANQSPHHFSLAEEVTTSDNGGCEADDSKLKFHENNIEGTLTIAIPKNLVYLNMAGFARHGSKLNNRIRVVGGDNLKELYFSDAGYYSFTGTILGLENLKILDLSQNDGSELSSLFLNSFLRVASLNMSKMGLDGIFLSNQSRSPFHCLLELETLDLSGNGLYSLPPNLFSQNKKLKNLILAGNRLKSIPFDLESFRNLHTLDLRSNSFLRLSRHDTRVLGRRVMESSSFFLKLNGNVFSCGCASIRFLHWLQTTTMSLDNERNYSCALENGLITTTYDMRDVKGLWRYCRGETAFLTSLILLCLTALAFSLFTLLVKFKTQITAAVFQYFRKNFTLKTPQHYPIGVYIGYSDNDTDLACVVLRMFIENQLGLTTYLRHRDLLPASDMAMSIVTTINSSWRIVLVVTESYLADHWSYLAMKTAMYSVGSSNPGRLVLVIWSDSVGHQIPSYVLTAVQEDSIIRLTDRNDLTDEQKITLGKALLG